MGDYSREGGYSPLQDALTAFEDLTLWRLHTTVENVGGHPPRFRHVQVFHNLAGETLAENAKVPERRHRILPLLPMEKGVQLNLKITDSAGNKLVYLPSGFCLKVVKEKALEYHSSLKKVLREEDLPSRIEEQIHDFLDAADEGTVRRVFSEIGPDQEEHVRSVINHLWTPLYSLRNAIKREMKEGGDRFSLSDSPLVYPVQQLTWLLEVYWGSFLQFVQLEPPLGHRNDETYPEFVLVKHELEKKKRHPHLLSQEWRESLQVSRRLMRAVGWHSPPVYIPISDLAQSMHLRFIVPKGLRLLWVDVENTRGRIHRRLAWWCEKFHHEYKTWVNEGGELRGQIDNILAGIRRGVDRVGRLVLPDGYFQRRDTLESIFATKEGKYKRRTRNQTTYYIHLTRGAIDDIGNLFTEAYTEELRGDGNEENRAVRNEIEFRPKMLESPTSLVLATLSIGLSWVAGISALLSMGLVESSGGELLTGTVAAFASYAIFSYDKPVLRNKLLYRFPLMVAGWLIVLYKTL